MDNLQKRKRLLFSVDKTPVYPISLGGAGIGSSKKSIFFKGPVSERQAVETVLFSLENGINLIDTSPFYGNSEKKIGISLKEYKNRASLILSTKVGTHPIYKGYSPDMIFKSIDNSLKMLQTDYIDIVHIHDPHPTDLKKLNKEGGIEALLRLKEEKVILHIGLGVRNHDLHFEFMQSHYANVILPYLDYNVLCTKANILLRHAEKKNIAVMLGSALCMGLLSGINPSQVVIGHYDIAKDISIEKAIEMYHWCNKHNVNLMALNYQFILAHSAISTIVIGACCVDEIKGSLKAHQENIDQTIMDSFLKKFGLY